jgi:hypothetical protein
VKVAGFATELAMNLTDKQRAMLARAVDDGGAAVLMNRSDTLVARHLADMGLGTTGLVFEVNDAGRKEIGNNVDPNQS